MDAKFVAYFRVSTDKQGRSGLGLEAQQAAVDRYVQGKGSIVATFTEVESGKRNARPELASALTACRQHRAILLVAKLDRLARNVAFISNLMESNVEFVAADMPKANRLTIHILAAVAEHERQMISERTKAALAAAKARGTRLGNPRIEEAQHKAMINRKAAFGEIQSVARSVAIELQAKGLSLRKIAKVMNERQMNTPLGRRWHAQTIKRLFSNF